LFEMPTDEGRVSDLLASIVEVGELAFGRFGKARRIGAVGQAGDLQQSLGLGDEGAWIGKTELRSKRVERNHARLLDRRRSDSTAEREPVKTWVAITNGSRPGLDRHLSSISTRA